MFVKADEAIRKDPADFADFGLAYTFYENHKPIL